MQDFSRSPIVITTTAEERSPVSECWLIDANDSDPRHANALLQPPPPKYPHQNFKTVFISVFEAGERGIDFRFRFQSDAHPTNAVSEALRPDNLPSTILFALQPTSSARIPHTYCGPSKYHLDEYRRHVQMRSHQQLLYSAAPRNL